MALTSLRMALSTKLLMRLTCLTMRTKSWIKKVTNQTMTRRQNSSKSMSQMTKLI